MIHREGHKISLFLAILLAVINALFALVLGTGTALYILNAVSVIFFVFILRFFRDPRRKAPVQGDFVFAPADGTVLTVEEATENEYFQDKRMKISVFMSIWNIHINWYPTAGTVVRVKYHPGRYLVARHPKSSILNERNTCVLRAENGTELLVRQIAGTVARRIISYAAENSHVKLGDQLGFIRFGSRVDIYLPTGTEILVKPGQKTRGLLTPVAKIK